MIRSLFRATGLLVIFLVLAGCEEEPLPVILEEPEKPLSDTTYLNPTPSLAQGKIVLLEDVTGVTCPTCPKGHETVTDIQTAHPDKVVAIAIHPGGISDPSGFNQAEPFDGEPNFNLPEISAKIWQIIDGKPNGIPCGITDRVDSELGSSGWAANVDQRLAIPPTVNATILEVSYDESNRELRYKVQFEVTEVIGSLLYYSTAIMEDSIISKQKHTGGTYNEYVHNHILRAMPQFSEALNPGGVPALEPGRVFEKEFKFTLKNDWNADHCKIATYVHLQREVIQAAEKHIK